MSKKMLTVKEAFWPDGRYVEYFLQRLRAVLHSKTPAFRVEAIRDLPHGADPDDFPCIEVIVRVPGLKLQNPVMGRQLVSVERLKGIFESWPVQEAYWKGFAQYIADSIPPDSPEADLKQKFLSVGEGRPSNLPARADLWVWHSAVVDQLKAVKRFLREQDITQLDEGAESILLAALRQTDWPWIGLVENDKIGLIDIAFGSPTETAKQILAEVYGTSVEAVHSRLFRPES